MSPAIILKIAFKQSIYVKFVTKVPHKSPILSSGHSLILFYDIKKLFCVFAMKVNSLTMLTEHIESPLYEYDEQKNIFFKSLWGNMCREQQTEPSKF